MGLVWEVDKDSKSVVIAQTPLGQVLVNECIGGWLMFIREAMITELFDTAEGAQRYAKYKLLSMAMQLKEMKFEWCEDTYLPDYVAKTPFGTVHVRPVNGKFYSIPLTALNTEEFPMFDTLREAQEWMENWLLKSADELIGQLKGVK